MKDGGGSRWRRREVNPSGGSSKTVQDARIPQMKSIQGLISELEAERDRIDAAINALSGISAKGARKRRKLSAAGRKRIAAAQRARWAKFKRGTRP